MMYTWEFAPGSFINIVWKNASDHFSNMVERKYFRNINNTLAEKNPRDTTEIALTEKFVRYLEDIIRQYPDMWLWSHRRFRHEWKPEYGPVVS